MFVGLFVLLVVLLIFWVAIICYTLFAALFYVLLVLLVVGWFCLLCLVMCLWVLVYYGGLLAWVWWFYWFDCCGCLVLQFGFCLLWVCWVAGGFMLAVCVSALCFDCGWPFFVLFM